MAELPAMAEDPYARGHSMAQAAIIAEVLKALIANRTLPARDVRGILEDVRDMFRQPSPSLAQTAAAGVVQKVLDNVFPATARVEPNA